MLVKRRAAEAPAEPLIPNRARAHGARYGM